MPELQGRKGTSRQSVGCTESEGGGTEDEERGVKTKSIFTFRYI